VRRRDLLHQAAGALVAFPVAAALAASRDQRVPSIVLLSGFARGPVERLYKDLVVSLNELGWIDGQNVRLLETRIADGRYELLPALAAEVMQLRPSVVIVQSLAAARALRPLSGDTPVVMQGLGDPVSDGLVNSLPRPGGSWTGTSYLEDDLIGKLIELLRDATAALKDVAFFINPSNPSAARVVRAASVAAGQLNVSLLTLAVSDAKDFAAAFDTIRASRPGGIVVGTDPLIRAHRSPIADLASDMRIPLGVLVFASLLDRRELLSLAPARVEFGRMTARYVDQILRGASPAELPIEQPNLFEIGVSLHAARTLGITLPPSLLTRADAVIE
jgi:putative tryptophan/tyrosine transport system substrate-binding protein